MVNTCVYGMCVAVLYAAELGNKMLDDSVLRTRREVYCLENGENSSEVDADMDDTLPFYQEIVFHRVFSITVGERISSLVTAMIVHILYDGDGECLLKGKSDGSFLVKDSVDSNGCLFAVVQAFYNSCCRAIVHCISESDK